MRAQLGTGALQRELAGLYKAALWAQGQDFRHGRQVQQEQHGHHHPPHHGRQHALPVIPHHTVRPMVIDDTPSNRLDHRDMRRHDRRYNNNDYNARGPQFGAVTTFRASSATLITW